MVAFSRIKLPPMRHQAIRFTLPYLSITVPSSSQTTMTLTNETIVGIISLFVMCFFSSLAALIRFMRCRKKKPTNENMVIPLEPITSLDDIASLEGGMLYTTRNIRVDTLMVRSATVPNLRWTFYHRGSDLGAVHI
ncbi:hypothetical protein F4776DRAFT_602455 [Hypoxylon sp. NC0597]|nr:hypothetical protein F4776DRAFT_602455 [Hypoxylon sp. NC0597]